MSMVLLVTDARFSFAISRAVGLSTKWRPTTILHGARRLGVARNQSIRRSPRDLQRSQEADRIVLAIIVLAGAVLVDIGFVITVVAVWPRSWAVSNSSTK